MSDFTSEHLIFLISQPRAGSTMLQRILAGQSQIHTTAEPWLMLHPSYALRSHGYEAEYDADLALQALQDFCDTLPAGEEHYREAIRRMAFYLYGAATQQAGKTIFLDKTPRYYLIIPDLARLMPNAKFILLYRNPLAVLNSLLNTTVKGRWLLLANHKNDLLRAPGLLVEAGDSLGDRAFVLQYEAFVSEPQPQLRSLCDWLGLDYQPQMLEYGQAPSPQGDMGDSSTVHKLDRPSTDRLYQWQELANQPQTRHFALQYLETLGPDLLQKMGYSYDDLARPFGSAPPDPGDLEITWQQIFEPDAALSKQQKVAALAMLEKRRLARRLRRTFNKK